jgi:hypothetical protein
MERVTPTWFVLGENHVGKEREKRTLGWLLCRDER